MNKRAEKEFEQLEDDTSNRAAAIECSPSEYRNGLRSLIARLQTDIAASAESDDGNDDEDEGEF